MNIARGGAINLLDPEALARRNARAALKISAVAVAVIAILAGGVHAIARSRFEELRAARAAEKTKAAEARLSGIERRARAVAEGLDHLRAAAASRGRAPGLLAWLGGMPWDGACLTELRLDPASGRLSLAGLARRPELPAELAARLSSSGLAGEVRPLETGEEELEGRRLPGFRLEGGRQP